jgi:hypothetical protein
MIPAALVSRDLRIMSLRSPPVITTLFLSWKGGELQQDVRVFHHLGGGIYLAMITTEYDIL